MPKRRKYEQVRCAHFSWVVLNRAGIWYADGRSNLHNAGRHSLGTKDKKRALDLLPELDRVRAEDLGLVPRSEPSKSPAKQMSLTEGRNAYEKFIARPRVAGGVRVTTQKRYRAVFDKFIPFAESRGINVWNNVTADLLTEYAADLVLKGYAHKSLVNELTTLKQTVRWLIEAGHLPGVNPIELKLRKAESEAAYCYQPAEVKAMVDFCRQHEPLGWLAKLVIALACTGLRISELASLRWSDVDLAKERLSLTDESGRPGTSGQPRRETKSGRSRSFPIHRDLMVELRAIPRRDAYIFYGPRGGRLKPDTVRRILVREVLSPLAERFPTADGSKGFIHGRLHSFRHYFCSTCANNGVPERMVMDWLGHADSEMIRRYYHLHNEESRRRMNGLDFLGGAGGWSAGEAVEQHQEQGEVVATARMRVRDSERRKP